MRIRCPSSVFGCLSLLGALAVVGCSADPFTEIVVAISTDTTIGQVNHVGFEATLGDGETSFSSLTWDLTSDVEETRGNDAGLPTKVLLPAYLTVVPGPETGSKPLLFVVSGHLTDAAGGQRFVLERRAKLAFVEGRRLMLQMALLGRCIGVKCGEDETCGENGCEKIEKIAAELPEFTPGRARQFLDAGAGLADQSQGDSFPDLTIVGEERIPDLGVDGGDGAPDAGVQEDSGGSKDTGPKLDIASSPDAGVGKDAAVGKDQSASPDLGGGPDLGGTPDMPGDQGVPDQTPPPRDLGGEDLPEDGPTSADLYSEELGYPPDIYSPDAGGGYDMSYPDMVTLDSFVPVEDLSVSAPDL